MLAAIVIFFFAAAGVSAGLRLARRGWVGNAIDDHLCCGRCGFDLSGLPASAACPECGGQDFALRRIGNRKKEPWRIASGVALTLISVLIFTTVVANVVVPGRYRAFLPLWVVRAEAGSNSQPAIDELARRVRSGTLSVADIASITDAALVNRHADAVGLRATWGDVVDVAVASGKLDKVRLQRCLDEAIGVHWFGNSERFKDANGKGMLSSALFTFGPAVGPSSSITFDAELESAQVDGMELRVESKETGVFYHHVRNPAPRDTFVNLALPDRVAGKVVTVRWRVKIMDGASGLPVAKDWVHTERIEVPAMGDGFFFGRSVRSDDPATQTGQ